MQLLAPSVKSPVYTINKPVFFALTILLGVFIAADAQAQNPEKLPRFTFKQTDTSLTLLNQGRQR